MLFCLVQTRCSRKLFSTLSAEIIQHFSTEGEITVTAVSCKHRINPEELAFILLDEEGKVTNVVDSWPSANCKYLALTLEN